MTNILFALLPDVVLLDVAGPAEAFRIANQAAPGSFSLAFAAQHGSISTGVGLQLSQLQALPETIAHDTIAVLTGVVGKRLKLDAPPTQHLTAWLRTHAHNPHLRVMCVCAGAVIAANAGLLAGKECTTHHTHLQELAQTEPTARVLDNRIFVQAGRVWTSAGITAGIDLALHIISQQCGAPVAAHVAREMVVYMRRAGGDPALSPWVMHRNHMHPAVHRVQDAVSTDPTQPWTVARMADAAHTSARNIARLFVEHAGCTPLDYLHQVRFALARELLTQSQLDVERVAEKAGFSSAHHLRRVWRKFEQMSPRGVRAG
jgi:transcriptional regulator GlxA family with amidase domain